VTAREPLRILFLSREYPPWTGGGGIGSYVQTMAHALARRGHEVHVLSCSEGQASEDHTLNGVHLHLRGVPRFVPKLRRWLPGTIRRLEGGVARYREYRRLAIDFDVVEAPDWLAEGLVFGLLGSRPLVVHLHTPLAFVERHNPASFRWTLDATLADRLERLAARRAHVATSPSRLLADAIVRERWLRKSNVRVIRYPIQLEAWTSAQGAEKASPRVLVVGRLEGRKAPEVLVEAAAHIRDDVPELDVVFVGSSSLYYGESYRDWLIRLAERLHAPCRFLGPIDRTELPALYAAARVVAVPSRYDNFPNAALEGMAAARPLVCTDRIGVAEMVTGTSAATVVAVDDPVALGDALRPFLVDPQTAARAGAEARSIVARECGPERIAEQREACYREAIELWSARRPGRHRGRLSR
jgi:glycogen synthase